VLFNFSPGFASLPPMKAMSFCRSATVRPFVRISNTWLPLLKLSTFVRKRPVFDHGPVLVPWIARARQ
jgi:hypothetical protein